MYCRNCGRQLEDNTRFCPDCGCPVENGTGYQAGTGNGNGTGNNTAFTAGGTQNTQTFAKPVSGYSRGLALIFAVLLGTIGVHRFYVGKIGTGILWILTFGCFGIGTLVDTIMIACGSYTDSNGCVLTDWKIN